MGKLLKMFVQIWTSQGEVSQLGVDFEWLFGFIDVLLSLLG
jgi:hypothetical protein